MTRLEAAFTAAGDNDRELAKLWRQLEADVELGVLDRATLDAVAALQTRTSEVCAEVVSRRRPHTRRAKAVAR